MVNVHIINPDILQPVKQHEIYTETFFFLMPPHVYTSFRGPPPGCGGSVTDF